MKPLFYIALITLFCHTAVAEDTALDKEIKSFRAKHSAHNAVLYNNTDGRAIDKKTGLMKGKAAGLGKPVSPGSVIIIAESTVPNSIVDLYTSIKKLPDCAAKVRVLYKRVFDGKTEPLLGYTIENPKGTYTKLVRYDGTKPYLKWIEKSFKADDADNEQLPAAVGTWPWLHRSRFDEWLDTFNVDKIIRDYWRNSPHNDLGYKNARVINFEAKLDKQIFAPNEPIDVALSTHFFIEEISFNCLKGHFPVFNVALARKVESQYWEFVPLVGTLVASGEPPFPFQKDVSQIIPQSGTTVVAENEQFVSGSSCSMVFHLSGYLQSPLVPGDYKIAFELLPPTGSNPISDYQRFFILDFQISE